jgi:hypothetical protein
MGATQERTPLHVGRVLLALLAFTFLAFERGALKPHAEGVPPVAVQRMADASARAA